MSHPYPLIEELADIKQITSFQDLVKIMNFVFTTIPWTVTPYEDLITKNDVEDLYKKFKKNEIGGWCGLHAEYFKWIIEGYRCLDSLNIRHRSYNFGIQGKMITHIGVAVEYNRMEFFFDPYFNRYFATPEGCPLQLRDILYLIQERKTSNYKSIFIESKKRAIRVDGHMEELTPQELLKEILESFELNNYTETMKMIFNNTNPDLLMLLKIPD